MTAAIIIVGILIALVLATIADTLKEILHKDRKDRMVEFMETAIIGLITNQNAKEFLDSQTLNHCKGFESLVEVTVARAKFIAEKAIKELEKKQ